MGKRELQQEDRRRKIFSRKTSQKEATTSRGGCYIKRNFSLESREPLPDWQVLLDLGYESHGGVGASVHGGQDGDDHKEPGGGAGRVDPRLHTVLVVSQRHTEALLIPVSLLATSFGFQAVSLNG